MAFEAGIEFPVGFFTNRAVRVDHQGAVSALGEFHLAFIGVDGSEGHIGIGEGAEGLAGDAGGFHLFGQERFLGFAEHVGFEAQELGEGDAEVRQEIVLQVAVHHRIVDGLDFRVHPAGGGGQPGGDVHIAAVEALDAAVSHILGLPEHDVVTQPLFQQPQLPADVFHGFGEDFH